MEVTVGAWEEPPAIGRVLQLNFPAVSGSWGRWALMANFASRYVAGGNANAGLVNSLSFVFNELIENAVKYGGEGEVEVGLFSANTGLTIGVSSDLSPQARATFLPVAHKLASPDASLPSSFGPASGIGLLSLIHFYRATLSFRFGVDRVTVVAKLGLKELSHED